MSGSLPRRIGRRVVPARVRRALYERRLSVWPPVGHVRLGQLRRTSPISPDFGYDRGTPIDRYFIERFVGEHARDIRGVALEFEDDAYLRRFGGDAVTAADVLSLEPGLPGATIVGDLAAADTLPAARFDCVVCTQVLQLVYDLDEAVANLHRMLRPGGVVLATMPGITRIARAPNGAWQDQWRLTSAAARTLFERVFGPENVETQWYGNPLVAIAFLTGLAVSELKPAELDARHPDYEVVIGVRAVRVR